MSDYVKEGKTYTKKMLARELAKEGNITIKDSLYAIDVFWTKVFPKVMRDGNHINIKGVGTIKTVTKKARRGVNNNKEEVFVDSFKAIKFTQSKKFKYILNNWDWESEEESDDE